MANKTVIGSAVLVWALCACSRGQQYQIRGQVLAVNPERQEVTVKHEDIPGFMPGMTMPFRVLDPKLLEGRVPGDLIVATLVVGENKVHLENLRRTGHAPVTDPMPAATAGIAPGEAVPDERFVDQSGEPRRLSDWRKKVIAVTFIYTRCPLPDFCPLMDRHFLSVQKHVDADPSLRGRVQLLSVSFDPGFDTPPVLAAYAKRVGADTASWSFLTGDGPDIDRFGSRLGVSIIREDKPAQEIVHNLRTAVIDGDGKLVKVFGGNEWRPEDLLAELRGAVGSR